MSILYLWFEPYVQVQHDNAVTWLASWTENIQGQIKYVMLNPSSKLKGEKDWQKYEKARKLKEKIDNIRQDYMEVGQIRHFDQFLKQSFFMS